MGPRLHFSALLGLALFWGALAHAYTPTVAPSGAAVKWKGNPRFNLAGNPGNKNGFSPESFRAAVVRGLQRWQAASGGNVSFDYWQGTNASVYEANSDYNGLSSVYFASGQNGGAGTGLSPNVLGLTQVWYNTDTGEILEADIVLNDRDFQFTSNAADTSGYGTGNTGILGGRNRVFIDNVLTHEIGHALGLSHAGGLQSTMLFMESPEQAFLSCDDLSAVHALYPSSDSASRGLITGSVIREDGKPVFGAHVLAISRRRGTVIASGLSDRDGRYAIGALEKGDYFLAAEPFLAGPQVLPAFYKDLNPAVCPDSKPFARTFLARPGGLRLDAVRVGARQQTLAPAIKVRCTTGGGAAVYASQAASGTGDSVIFNGDLDGNGFGIIDRFSTDTARYRLAGVSGRLELHALSYSLYSPVRPLLTLYDEFGNPVEARVSDRVYVGESGFTNYDAALLVQDLPRGDYVLEVDGRAVSASLYPAGPVMLDSVPFLVLTGSLNEAAPPLSEAMPFNARCRMNEVFPAYRSPEGDPPRRSVNGKDGGIGFCGSVNRDSGDSSGGPPDSGAPAGAIAGWFAPWLFMILFAQWMRTCAPGAARLTYSHAQQLSKEY